MTRANCLLLSEKCYTVIVFSPLISEPRIWCASSPSCVYEHLKENFSLWKYDIIQAIHPGFLHVVSACLAHGSGPGIVFRSCFSHRKVLNCKNDTLPEKKWFLVSYPEPLQQFWLIFHADVLKIFEKRIMREEMLKMHIKRFSLRIRGSEGKWMADILNN